MVHERKKKMSIGSFLKQLREEKGFSGASVARAVGFSATMLSKIELGKSMPSAERIDMLAAFYGVDALELHAQMAIDKGKIDVPAGVAPEHVRAAIYSLAAVAMPEFKPADPHAFHCPKCGVDLVCSERS